MHRDAPPASPELPERLFVYNGGFLSRQRVRRILELAGWRISLGRPGPEDWVGVWGKSPTAPRGETAAARSGARILRVEDAFLRSVLTGREGEAPTGLCLDRRGVHFDSSAPCDLEVLLATAPLDDTALLDRARAGIDRMRHAHISKYNAFLPSAPLPEAPYVLVIDQTRDDASIAHGAASAGTFREMLVFALTEHPGNRVIIKAHPETLAGRRAGHFDASDENDRVRILRHPVSPWALFEGATAVYTVSSQLGFEAIFAGHRPRVFGQPFYAGWGLSADENPVARRTRRLSRAQLFAAAMILYPTWYDPAFDRLCSFEEALGGLEARARAWREDRRGHVAAGMALWKRAHMQRFFGRQKPLKFTGSAQKAARKAGVLLWGAAEEPRGTGLRDAAPGNAGPGDAAPPADGRVPVLRVEDGFVRSRGLGAALVAPLSLVTDDLGIYFDATRESRLDRLIAASCALPQGCLARARDLIRTLNASGLTKYNLPGAAPGTLPQGRRILVVGQVEDDASIRLGCTEVNTNAGLLGRARAENPDAVIVYKPHPDVEAGLRPGALDRTQALRHADIVAEAASAQAMIALVDEVWTMTSLLGFEALIRKKPVTCLGAPFYAGWGLTRDLGTPPPAWRRARPSLEGLVHAALIDYARYLDPVSGQPCSVETVLRRLGEARGAVPRPGIGLSALLARLQGLRATVLPRR